MDRNLILMGALAGVTGVGLGAFGAHGLRGQVSPEMMAVFETGVRYHIYHALALLATAAVMNRIERGALALAAGYLFLAGIVLFSGSLYLLALTGVRALGAITPVGGLAFMAGWALLAYAAI